MAVLLLLLPAGCINLDFGERREARLHLQVRDAATLGILEDVVVQALHWGRREVARGLTNAAGQVGLEFEADSVIYYSSERDFGPWIVLRFERLGYQPLDLPLGREDFVETSRIRLRTQGVMLRRSA